jgi:hypothetical protein
MPDGISVNCETRNHGVHDSSFFKRQTQKSGCGRPYYFSTRRLGRASHHTLQVIRRSTLTLQFKWLKETNAEA